MKKVILYRNILLGICLLTSLSGYSQDYRRSKKVSKAFKVSTDAELTIINKYGRIQLISWAKDSIKFEVAIEVRAKKEAKADEIIKDISIDFVNFPSYVESKTTFTSQDSFWGDMKDKTGSVFSGDNKTQIDYRVYVPATAHISLQNKYGDIYLEDHTGPLTIDLANGDLKARNLTGVTSLSLEFAYATIKKFSGGSINMDHKSELSLDEAGTIKIDSRSSRINIGDVKSLDLKSYRDKYVIGKVNSMTADNAYTYLEITSLGEYLNANARYGNIEIQALENKVKSLDFKVADTDVDLVKPENRSITIEAIYSEAAGLYFPSELINKKTTMEDEEKKLVKTVGMVGDNFTAPIKLNITIPTGNLNIK